MVETQAHDSSAATVMSTLLLTFNISSIIVENWSWKVPPALLLFGFVAWTTAQCFYNYFLHPLAHIPGPKLGATTRFWYARSLFSGFMHTNLLDLHRKYGPVVRIQPDHISFATASSWKEIYGFHTKQPPFPKTEFYEAASSAPRGKNPGIILDRDIERHGQSRRLMSHAFSSKALLEQEDAVRELIDQFLAKLEKYGQGEEGMVVTHWFSYLTFDVMGKLAFGNPFGCLLNEEPHFWVKFVIDNFQATVALAFLTRYPLFLHFLRSVLFRAKRKALLKQVAFTRDMIRQRIQRQPKQPDFMTEILTRRNPDEVPDEELATHASSLITAGSETLSSFFTAAMYLLGTHPEAYHRLKDEIRNEYTDIQAINAVNTQKLQYLNAVIEECLRVVPPISLGLPRYSPGAEVDGIYLPPGTEVYTHPFGVVRDERYFPEPEKFRPERWLDRGFVHVKEANQPFSIGPRGCIGRNLAYVEMRLVLATMLYRFDFELLEKPFESWDRAVKGYATWVKPDIKVRFTQAHKK